MSTCRSHASVQKHALPPRCLEDLSLHDGPRDQHLAVATLIDDVTEVPVQNPPRPLDILGKLTPETVRGNDLDGSSSTVVPEKVMIPVYDAHDRGVLPLCDLALAPTDSDSYLPECVDSFRESCGRRPSVHSAELPASSWECDTEVRPRVRDAVRVGTSEQQCEPQLDGIHTPLDACRGLDTQRSEVGAWWEHTRGVLTSVYRRCAPPLSGRHKLQHAITADDTDVSDSLGDSAQPSETDDHDELEVHTDDGRPLPVDWEGMRSEMAPFVNAQLCGHLKQTKAVLGVVYEACASRPPKSESPVHQAHPGGTLVDDTLDKEDPRFPVRRTDTIWEQSTATLVFVYERCAHY